ncbi:transposase family protein [Streptomyces xanthophaeus]
MVFIDRLLATLVHLRHGATHDVLGCWFGVDRSTITRAIGEVRPLLAARGCTVATGIRVRRVISGKNKQLTGGPAVAILADAGYRGLGAQTGGPVVTPPHRKFKKNPRDWYEEIYERRRKAHSSRRIRVEHGITHLKNWRALARHLGRFEHMSDTIQAVAGLLSHQQTVTRGAGQAQ